MAYQAPRAIARHVTWALPMLPSILFLNLFWSWICFHELIQYVDSSAAFETNCIYKCHIWMASFLHELMQHIHITLLRTAVVTNVTFERLFPFMNWFFSFHCILLWFECVISRKHSERILTRCVPAWLKVSHFITRFPLS